MSAESPSVDPDGGEVEGELHRVPDAQTARLENPIPDETEVRALELCVKGERDPLAAFEVEPGATKLAVERERPSHTLDRQLAGKRERPLSPFKRNVFASNVISG
jgi:hypothetical protein